MTDTVTTDPSTESYVAVSMTVVIDNDRRTFAFHGTADTDPYSAARALVGSMASQAAEFIDACEEDPS